jgi:hypothetical protein
MSTEEVYKPGKRVLRSNSAIARPKTAIKVKMPAKRTLQSNKTKSSRNASPYVPVKPVESRNKENMCCALTETVNRLVLQNTKQYDDLIVSKNQNVDLQQKYIKALEMHYVQKEKAMECKQKMEEEILFLKSKIPIMQPERFVQDLIDFDNDANRGKGHFKFFPIFVFFVVQE